VHLAPSFDTFGWLFRDLEDAPILASLFSPDGPVSTCKFSRFAVIDESFLHDCEPEIVAGLQNTVAELKALGLSRSTFDPAWWADSFGIYAPIQAWEAAQIHAGHFDRFEPSIRERLEWGSRISERELASLHVRHATFLGRMNDLLATHQLLLLPVAPVARLAAGADHRLTRVSLLRYTTPFSLAGVPVVTLPCAAGGMQLAAAHNCDESLVQLAAALGAGRKSSSTI
jgi:aspartyl-tRNA(Asn)/glutamyl-tRNA(Gln) amidotransferase subunit A